MTCFNTFSIHAAEKCAQATIRSLKAERARDRSFSEAGIKQAKLDPETAARRLAEQALQSDRLPAFALPKIDAKRQELKSLGVKTLPMTGTRIVQFRQYVDRIPVCGSLITVELDARNELVSINSTLGNPGAVSTLAAISPRDALDRVAEKAGYRDAKPDSVPRLNIYLDKKGEWRLVYIFEDVVVQGARSSQSNVLRKAPHYYSEPYIFDFVIDAMSGALVVKLPRMPGVARAMSLPDEFGALRTFDVEDVAGNVSMIDEALGVETYDFALQDLDSGFGNLPGKILQSSANPASFSSAAVSAHANATVVARFLRDVLNHNGLDGSGGLIRTTVNCVRQSEVAPPGSNDWFYSGWEPLARQVVYGQVTIGGAARSLAASLCIVAHEIFHGVTSRTARLEYLDMPGALNESYSDIFDVIISNLSRPIGQWSWLIGEGLQTGKAAMRDLSDPLKFGQPKHMRDYVNTPDDHGGVHTNSGIHNFAAYTLMTTEVAGNHLFSMKELAGLFYIALTGHLSRQSEFSDSRRGLELAAESLFRSSPEKERAVRLSAIAAAFDAAGIAASPAGI